MLSWCYVMNRATDTRISHANQPRYRVFYKHGQRRTPFSYGMYIYIYADYRLHTSTFERGGVGCTLGGVSRRARHLIKIFYYTTSTCTANSQSRKLTTTTSFEISIIFTMETGSFYGGYGRSDINCKVYLFLHAAVSYLY